MKIQTMNEYEDNHKAFEDMTDEFLVEMIHIFQETYEMLVAEAIYRLMKPKFQIEKRKTEIEQLRELKSILEREIVRYNEIGSETGVKLMMEKLKETEIKIKGLENEN